MTGDGTRGARKGPPARAGVEHGSALSIQRAFVVHFSADPRPGRRRFRGRVEHLPSGTSAPFSSLKGLLAFFAAVLDVVPPVPVRKKGENP
jgi:hypothetical protein